MALVLIWGECCILYEFHVNILLMYASDYHACTSKLLGIEFKKLATQVLQLKYFCELQFCLGAINAPGESQI